MDESGVEYLLGKCSDELVGGLQGGTYDGRVSDSKKTFQQRRCALEMSDAGAATHVFQTQPLSFDFFHIVDFAPDAKLCR